MASIKKVAIITGGASGIGYSVAAELASKGDWNVDIFDMNAKSGNKAAEALGVTFQQVNVTDYSSLAAAFKTTFQASRRIDFVHANAGIIEKGDFYEVHDTGDEPPPEITKIVGDVVFTSVIDTSYLAQHYFRQTPKDGLGPRSLVITASCSGFYSSARAPVYAAAKHGVVGWTRSICSRMWREDGIRVNAICPGLVRTNILPEEFFSAFPEQHLIPIDRIVKVVIMLLDGRAEHVKGTESEEPLIGQTVEISGTGHYFRTQNDVPDEHMASIMSLID